MTSVAPQPVAEPLTDAETAALTMKLAKAKTSLILEHPFVGTVAMNMPFEITDAVPTAATNGKKVMFNPQFCNELTDEEMKFLVAHECMHPMLEHNYRRNERTHQRWNQAADYVINKLLIDDKIGKKAVAVKATVAMAQVWTIAWMVKGPRPSKNNKLVSGKLRWLRLLKLPR